MINKVFCLQKTLQIRRLGCICSVFIYCTLTDTYRLSEITIAICKFNVIVILYHYPGRRIAGEIIKHNKTAVGCMLTFYYYINVPAAVEGIEYELCGIFNNNLREEKLTARENISVSGVSDIYTYTVILIGMVKGTSNDRAVGIIILVSKTVIHKKRSYVTVETTVNEYVISAVVYTAVAIFNTENVSKLMVFAEIRNIYTCSAAENMAIGYSKRCSRTIPCFIAGNSTTRKGTDEAGIYNSMHGLRI